jgi:hypothetical protein
MMAETEGTYCAIAMDGKIIWDGYLSDSELEDFWGNGLRSPVWALMRSGTDLVIGV